MDNFSCTLSLVGAGPGDPELITLKGIKSLQKADVVLYDALACKELLTYAPNALKIFVGKRNGFKAFSQLEIQEIIVNLSKKYRHIVRLKGGDPFVFGRGLEELDHVEPYGINAEVIPGITSAISVPSRFGIGVTKRGVSESFWVITGTTSSHRLSADLKLAVQSSATVVILMGMSRLEQIVEIFQQENKGDRPIAIIQNGTTSQEKIGFGLIDNILGIANEQELSNPAVIIIGEVVRESLKLKEFYKHNYTSFEYAV
ncbi:uroporphyrinogen-III C-methyltransferase [Namhaeicola litoreus]|uniref:uroporphyrinogen-III C-methyltransferase n=1 Tax=Namhaeicola litoreus TaxID=1052145 RepID=A0ABW3Y175_9FLAO